MGDFNIQKQNCSGGVGETKFFYFFSSATKSSANLRMFKYELPLDFLSKGLKTTAGVGDRKN